MPKEPFAVEKPAVLKASTPGSHPLIRAVWLTAFVLLLAAVAMQALGAVVYPAVALIAAGLLVAGVIAYVVRHVRFLGTLSRGEQALRAGDLTGRARGREGRSRAASRSRRSFGPPGRGRARVPRLPRWRRRARARRAR